MKVAIIQPEYSTDYSRSEELFEKELALLDLCDETLDIIVLPEYADIPALAKTKEEADGSSRRFNKILLDKCSETAQRCHAILFVNARSSHQGGERNTTWVFTRDGSVRGHYYKQHLVENEVKKTKLDSDYTFEWTEPDVIEIEGIRFAFLTCYDFYFYEAFPTLARKNVDVIIGCSHQRTDTHLALEIMGQFLAYNTNAYVLRSSVSMDENSQIGGGSMVVAPTGEILLNMKSRVGIETVELDVTKKYYKPAGFGNPPSAHYEYIEKGRRPWKYRPAGSMIVKTDEIMPYPRRSVAVDCSEKDFMYKVGGAIGEGIEEIAVINADLSSIEKLFKKFSCHAVMNIITDGENLDGILALREKYDCEKYVYFTTDKEDALAHLKALNVTRAYLGYNLEKTEEYGCTKVLLTKATKEEIDAIRKKDIRVITKDTFGVCCDVEIIND